jgi:hypothetical protein
MVDGKIAADTVSGAGAGEGGDVAGQQGNDRRSPDAIQKEIEQTRAELAETIDAIADRISPRRAASRGASAVKAQVSSVFSGRNGAGPASVLDAAPEAAGRVDTEQRRRAVAEIAREGGGAQYTGTSEFAVQRRLRTDRVLIAVGVVAVAAAAVILWRARD